MLLAMLIGMLVANVQGAWATIVTSTSTFTGYTLGTNVLTSTEGTLTWTASTGVKLQAAISPPTLTVNGNKVTSNSYYYYNPVTVELNCESLGDDVRIYYTTDGTMPDESNGTLYTEPFELVNYDDNASLNAISYVDGNFSNVASWTFYYQLADLTFSQTPNSLYDYHNTTTYATKYEHAFDLELGVRNNEAVISYYLSDEGSANMHTYTGPIHMTPNPNKNTQILDITVSYQNSNVTRQWVARYNFGLNSDPKVVVDGVEYAGYSNKLTQPVTVAFSQPENTEDDVAIYYNMGLSSRVANDYSGVEGTVTSGTITHVPWDGNSFTVDYPCEISFVAYNGEVLSTRKSCSFSSKVYPTYNNIEVPGVASNPYKYSQNSPFTVTLGLKGTGYGDYSIYYTSTEDGTEPAEPTVVNGTPYDGTAFNIDGRKRIKWIGYNGSIYSYGADMEFFVQCAAPVCNILTGNVATGGYNYRSSIEVSFGHGNTPNSTIYYTLDGTDPSTGNGILYDGNIFVVDTTCVLKAIAYCDGVFPSDIIRRDITITIPEPNIYPSEYEAANTKYEYRVPIYFGEAAQVKRHSWVPYFTIDGTDPLTSETRIEGSKNSNNPYYLDHTATVRYVSVDGRSHSSVKDITYYVKENPGLAFEQAEYVITYGETFVSPEVANPYSRTLSWSSSDPNVATVDEQGQVTILKPGETEISAYSEGDDDFQWGSATFLLRVIPVVHLGNQENNNEYNTCVPLDGLTVFKPTPGNYSEVNIWELPHMMDGNFYVSAYWHTNNYLAMSEYWSYGDNALQISCSPMYLTPNWGSNITGDFDQMSGLEFGGMICFKVPAGKATISVRGFTESTDAFLGICVAGCEPMEYTGTNMQNFTYEFETEEEAWAYVYGANVSYNGRHAYVNNVVYIPDGAEYYNVKVGDMIANGDVDIDLLGDGTIVFHWGYPTEEESENYGGPGGDDIVNAPRGASKRIGEDGGEEVDKSVATIILNNANFSTTGKPAIEVNGLDAVYFLLAGDNTLSSTGAAAISIGTLEGMDTEGCQTYFYPHKQGGTHSLTITGNSNNGIYVYNGTLNMYDVKTNIYGSEYGVLFNDYEEDFGGGGEAYARKKSEPAKIPSNVSTRSMFLEGGDVSLTGGTAAIWGAYNFRYDYYNGSICASDKDDFVYSSDLDFRNYYDGEGGDLGFWYCPEDEDPDNYDNWSWRWCKYFRYADSDAILFKVKVGDVIAYGDGNLDLLGDGTVMFHWGYPTEEDCGETEGGGDIANAPRKVQKQIEKNVDRGSDYNVATIILNNANLSTIGKPAIEANSLDEVFFLLNGDNTLSSTGAAAISLGTREGKDLEGKGCLAFFYPTNEVGANSLTIPDNSTNGIYVYNGAVVMEGVAANISGDEYGVLFTDYEEDFGGGGEIYARKKTGPTKLPQGMDPRFLYLSGGDVSLRGGTAAIWGAYNFYYDDDEGSIFESDMDDFVYSGYMDFESYNDGEGGCVGFWYCPEGEDPDNYDNWQWRWSKYLRYGVDPMTFTEPNEDDVDLTYRITDEVNHTVALGPSKGGDDYTTSLGKVGYTFEGTVTIPATVTHDGVEYQVTTLAPSAFDGCSSISCIKIEAVIQSLGQYVFYDCSSMKELYLYNTTTPPTFDVDTDAIPYVFNEVTECILYVPAGSKDAYEASPWADYFTIMELDGTPQLTGDVNGDGEVNISDVTNLVNMVLAGGYSDAANINGDEFVNVTDVTLLVDIILGKR